ncbi:MAG: hypothetical protein KME26_17350 [Oscillatoria princeps RMCB-10]|nr:hypothetical protein [Oscillatoria princeps RMCB-10]
MHKKSLTLPQFSYPTAENPSQMKLSYQQLTSKGVGTLGGAFGRVATGSPEGKASPSQPLSPSRQSQRPSSV